MRGPAICPSSAMPATGRSSRRRQASALIVAEDGASRAAPFCGRGRPYFAFARALELFHPPTRPAPGREPARGDWRRRRRLPPTRRSARSWRLVPARRSAPAPSFTRTSRLAQGTYASAPTACCTRTSAVREGVALGDRVTVHNGAVIGSDGFGFTPGARRPLTTRFPQVGTRGHRRRCGDRREHDHRSRLGRARRGLGPGTKIDNLVQVGHSVQHRPRRAARRAGRHLGQHDAGGSRHARRPGRRSGAHHDRQGRGGGGAVGHHQLGRAGPLPRPAIRRSTTGSGGRPRSSSRGCRSCGSSSSRCRSGSTRSRRGCARGTPVRRRSPAATLRSPTSRRTARRTVGCLPGPAQSLCHNRNDVVSSRGRRFPLARSVAGCARRRASPACVLGVRAAGRAERPPKLEYTHTKLPNGSAVVFHEDHSTPIVHVAAAGITSARRTRSRAAPGSRTCSST